MSGCEILSAISNSIEETIWKELDEAIAFGIMVDESTNILCEPILLYLLSIVCMEILKYIFLKLLQLRSKDSKSIFEAIISIFDEKGKF